MGSEQYGTDGIGGDAIMSSTQAGQIEAVMEGGQTAAKINNAQFFPSPTLRLIGHRSNTDTTRKRNKNKTSSNS